MKLNRNLSGCQVFHPENSPSEWHCVPLRQRVELAYGRALPEDERRAGDVDVYGSNGKVGRHNVPLVNGPGILIGRKGTIGAVHFSPRPFWPIDTVYYVVPLANDDLRFLYHLLNYLPLNVLNAATGVPGLSRRDAYALRGIFPSSKEQFAIARILDSADTALERTRSAIEEAKGLKRALLQRFFYSALGETAYADRPRKELPKGWKLVPTETLLAGDPKNGVSPKASSQPPGIPTFSIAAVRDGRVDLENRDNLKFAQVPDKVAKLFRVQRGNVLIVRGNANPDLVGKAGMIDRFPEGCIYPDITKRVVFRTEGKQTVIPEFAVLAWNHPIVHNQVLRRAKTSNGTLKINNRDVKQIVMPVPTADEQLALVKLVAGVDAKMDALIAALQAYKQIKRSLMHDLLTGRVRLKNIEAVLKL
jgi:type I restriction enzyme S subunit